MELPELKDMFAKEILPLQANEWELDDLLENLLELTEDKQLMLISYVPVIWPVSHSLCFSFLEYGSRYIERYGNDSIAEWVRQLLGCYEKEGLRTASLFMFETADAQKERHYKDAEVGLEDVRGKLVPFIRGVSGRQLEISSSDYAWTDTETIFLPESVTCFSTRENNIRLYTYLACCQWGYITLGSLNTDDMVWPLSGKPTITVSKGLTAKQVSVHTFLASFPNPELSMSMYHFLEFSRVHRMLCAELPGLIRSMQPLLISLLQECNDSGGQCGERTFYALMLALVGKSGLSHSPVGNIAIGVSTSLQERCQQVEDFYATYPTTDLDDWPYFEKITGRLHFDKVRERVTKKRLEEKEAFIHQLALLVDRAESGQEDTDTNGNVPPPEADLAIPPVVNLSRVKDDASVKYTLNVNSEAVSLPQDFIDLLSQVERELGHIPEGYVQAAAGVAGRGRISGQNGAKNEALLEVSKGKTLYDEWDYRRKGYRRNWCAVIEKDIQPVRSSFVENTLDRYRGIIVRLRRQFEMLRTQHRFIRRRRYGDDIDFDALVEAVGDRAAGVAPSERLFIRLLRDERDIAVLFLVDMSNSTEGWVGKAIKESLVLLGDVMEVVGDRYGIYGFSGMRRSRCELYRIKKFEEPYSEIVQQRICAMSPKEYTRMAPPLRHLTQMLVGTEARVRLLVTISDGKPEDYDDYNGDYAIEDTRQALIEARGLGIIPFCITVDREPHSYLPHMYGEGNYIYVDSVEKLPRRMADIYRLLTS